MSFSIKHKDFTTILIGLLTLSFVFYLYNAKPTENFGLNQNIETNLILEMNKTNSQLNERATFLPEKVLAIESNTKDVFTFVEFMPKFVNCEYLNEENGFICTKRYILDYAQRISLPLNKTIEKKYTAFVKFIINEKGYIENVKILNPEPNELNEIVKEHIEKMPKFAKPGYQDDIAVKVQYVIPVTIKPTTN